MISFGEFVTPHLVVKHHEPWRSLWKLFPTSFTTSRSWFWTILFIPSNIWSHLGQACLFCHQQWDANKNHYPIHPKTYLGLVFGYPQKISKALFLKVLIGRNPCRKCAMQFVRFHTSSKKVTLDMWIFRDFTILFPGTGIHLWFYDECTKLKSSNLYLLFVYQG